ncbi:TonB-dependent receptor [Paremcibacter congregatus]|uniref:TonB-dependent receptor n=1 Tax=Paremcibacter congregatus TaxID=2043170 RepID=A0A2G4YW43_9PROT|nr:TonB-dependent receptor [Paremcibacter congregatus]PHZ86545.1 hypothetical protein CRD36_01290 [Paremcibacter congregatus]QDE26349.1 TonB-dependent receptor [Paremcibacter congregatus]
MPFVNIKDDNDCRTSGRFLLKSRVSGCVMAALFLAGLSVPAQAAEEEYAGTIFEEIIVTATKRSTSLQDTPLSISAFTGETLDKMGYQNARDFIAGVPGVSLIDQGAGDVRITIRNVGSSIAQGSASAVAFYLDEFPLTLPEIELIDMERVEILKGPQGTLYGRASMGGTVRYISNAPNVDGIEGGVKATYSNTNEGSGNYNGSGYLNVPLSDKLAIRGVFYYDNTSGIIDNPLTGKNNIDGTRTIGGRLALKYAITEAFSFEMNYLYNKETSDGLHNVQPLLSGVSLEDGVIQIRPIDQPSEFKQRQLSATLSGAFDGFDVTLAASRSWRDFERRRDVTLFAEANYDNVSIAQDTALGSSNDTIEVRATSNGERTIDWIVGFWAEQSRSSGGDMAQNDRAFNLFGFYPLPAESSLQDFIVDSGGHNIAGYGEVGVHFTDKLTMTLGYRHAAIVAHSTNQKADGVFDILTGGQFNLGVESRVSQTVDTYKAHLEYDFSDDFLIYASATSGFRAGGFNAATPVTPQTEYKSDGLWDYEIGLKGTFLNGRLLASLTGYRLDWTDMQLPSTDFLTGGAGIFNVGTARIEGIEAEVIAHVTNALQLGVQLGHSDPRLTENYFDEGVGLTAYAGDRIPGSAKTTINVNVDFHTPLQNDWELFARANYRYVGNQTANFNEALSAAHGEISDLPSYEIVDLRTGVDIPMKDNQTVRASVFVNNLFNKRAATGFDIFFSTSLFVNRPRTIGLEVNYDF